tara:strand:- start:1273 stop:1821 length:549 start_codon:yes stop_codon:yes gene_type:complete
MIKKFNDFLGQDDIDTIRKKIKSNNWAYGQKSKHSANYSFWAMREPLELDSFFTHTLFNKIKKITGNNLAFQRIYFNGHTAGSFGYEHKDTGITGMVDNPTLSRSEVTFLIYCNSEWKSEWGGYTAFKKDEDDYEIIYPKPWSAVYFQADITHHATPISIAFNDLRVTLAYKLIDLDKVQNV